MLNPVSEPPVVEEDLSPPAKRQMGFWARSALPSHLTKTLDRYNLEVRHARDDGKYTLLSKAPGLHPADILPDFIDFDDANGNAVEVDLAGLESALEFMHQPVRMAMRHAQAQKYDARANEVFEKAASLSAIHESAKVAYLQDVKAERKAIAKDLDDRRHREVGQSTLRFLTTGSVTIPVVTKEFDEVDECHADEENKMRDNDAWALNNEIGHKDHPVLFDVEDPPEDKIKTIPNAYFDPEKSGYVIKIHPSLLNNGALKGEQQKILRSVLIDALEAANAASDIDWQSEQVQGTREVVLTANQFANVCSAIRHTTDIEECIEAVQVEQDRQASDARIEKKLDTLAQSPEYKSLENERALDSAQAHDALDNVLKVTTALSPVINGPHMRKIWAEYYPTRKNETPFDDVIGEYAQMQHKLESLLDQKEITPAELEAFAQEYYKTLAFTDKMAEILEVGAGDQNSRSLGSRLFGITKAAGLTYLAYQFTETGQLGPDGEPTMSLLNAIAYGLTAKAGIGASQKVIDAVDPARRDRNQAERQVIQTNMQNVESIVQNTSLGGVSLEEEYLEDHHQETLTVFRRSLGQGGGFGAQALEAATEGGKEFIDDIVNSFKESRVTQISTVALSGYLIWNSMQSGYTASTQPAIDASAFNNVGGDGLGLDAFITADHTTEVDVPAVEVAFSCHTDFKPDPNGLLQAYKHCIFGTIVEDQASNMVSGADYVIQEKFLGGRLIEAVNNTFGTNIQGNEDSIFTRFARDAVKPTAYGLMLVNWLQNITHAGLWNYSANKGWKVGFDGYKESFSFTLPLVDIGIRAVKAPFASVSAALERVGVSKPSFLPDRSLSVHEHLNAFVADSPELANMGSFKISDLDRTVEVEAGVSEIQETVSKAVATWPEGLKPADISMKVGGFRRSFSLSSANINDVTRSLLELDLKLKTCAENIGVVQPWHHTIIKTHLDGVKDTLGQYLNDGDEQRLKAGLQEHLDLLSGFELRQTGQSKVLEAMTGREVEERVARVLTREANVVMGKESRLLTRIKHANNMMGINQPVIDGKKEAPKMGKVAYSGVALLTNEIWDKSVRGTRQLQRGYQYIGNRPALNIGLKVGAAALIAADATGTLPENDVAEGMTAGLGMIFGGPMATGSSFLVFNSGEDLLLIHTLMVSSIITVTATGAIAYKKGVSPAVMSAVEEIRERTPSDLMGKVGQVLPKIPRDKIEKFAEKASKRSGRSAAFVQDTLKTVGGRKPMLESRYGNTPSMEM